MWNFLAHIVVLQLIVFSPLQLHIKRKSTARKSISYRYIKCFKLTLPFNTRCRGFELLSSPRRTMQKLCIMLHKCGSTSSVAVLCSLKFLNVLFLSQVLFKKNSCGLVDCFFFSCREIWGRVCVWRRRKIAPIFLVCWGVFCICTNVLRAYFLTLEIFSLFTFVPQWPFFYLPYSPSVHPFFAHCKWNSDCVGQNSADSN